MGLRQARPKRSAVGAWISYDIANTVWWTGVLGVSFPLWLTNNMGGDDATWGYTVAATMTVVLLLSPILGSISDQSGRRMPLLIFTTIACIAATLMLGTGSLLSSLVLLAFAFCAMELGAIFYNSLLSEVSTEANRGLISGLGTGIGYLGSFISVGTAFVLSDSQGHILVMRVVAVLFLVFALPIFFLVPERSGRSGPWMTPATVRGAFAQLRSTLGGLHRFPGLRQFLLARLMYGLGVNTTVAFAVVYASQTVGMSDREIQLVLLAGICIAIPSGILWGRLVDRIGARPVLSLALLLWIGLLIFAVAIAWGSWTRHLWWGLGCITGLAMSGIWTADRPYMLSFTPPQYLGEFFGLHGMVGKLGRVIGPFGWALISGTLGFGQPVAVLCLAVCIVVSYVILTRIPAPVASPLPGPAD